MKNSKELLSSLLKTAQMGQVGIRSILDCGMQPGLRQALESQLREYDSIESEVHSLASQRGWELKELDPAVRFMSDMMARMKVTGKKTDSKVAGMMIRGNTRGVIKGLENIHRFPQDDEPVRILSRKLLDCEKANISQMYPFL